MITEFIIAIVASFVLTALLARVIIPILKSKKMGQYIKDIGPRWHKSKEGTPTMGGITFIGAILVLALVALLINPKDHVSVLLILLLGVLNGVIGFIDDYQKLIKKNNDGLNEKQKTILQVLAAGMYLFVMRVCGLIDTKLEIPFSNIEIELGIVYYLFAILLIWVMVNSVNITDGIDGLASTVTFFVSIFFAVVSFYFANRATGLVSGLLIGGMIGFLVYNLNPARVFMGDTGSLFLGGVITALAFALNEPLVVVICGLLYIAELATSALQVVVFKLSGRKKRLFKMAPYHHHLEQCGWSENKIVAVFSAITIVLSVVAWFAIK
jgi:phospho-N-acetylmuramoyl-pentapeptide-transferase